MSDDYTHGDNMLDLDAVMADEIEKLRKSNHQFECLNCDLQREIERQQACFDQRNEALIASCKRNRELQARVEALEGVLDKLARLGNEPHYGNSDGNVIAQKALAATEQDLRQPSPMKDVDAFTSDSTATEQEVSDG